MCGGGDTERTYRTFLHAFPDDDDDDDDDDVETGPNDRSRQSLPSGRASRLRLVGSSLDVVGQILKWWFLTGSLWMDGRLDFFFQ